MAPRASLDCNPLKKFWKFFGKLEIFVCEILDRSESAQEPIFKCRGLSPFSNRLCRLAALNSSPATTPGISIENRSVAGVPHLACVHYFMCRPTRTVRRQN